MKKTYSLSSEFLSLENIKTIISEKLHLELSQESLDAVQTCRDYLDRKMAASDEPIYGINTGFGSLCNRKISKQDLGKLQKNLVISHACGCGEEVPLEVVKIMLLLKVKSLAFGHSGVQRTTIQRLLDYYNNDIYPVVYQQGSLGASGDLAPLAHLCLPLLNLGKVYYQGKLYAAEEINAKFGFRPIDLQSKEGLALLNGTQFMAAYAVYLVLKAQKLSNFADIIGALSLDAFDGRKEPFNHLIQEVRPHSGQIQTGLNFNRFLAGSEIIEQTKEHVQDPYSFRCIPQVHGASKDAIAYIQKVVETEINSVTDNPLIFAQEDLILSGGNFHGQPLALVLDFLSLAAAELGNISERRIYQLVLGKHGLPSFLVKNPGLNSGFMIPQYTAASIVNQSKTFTMPSSSDSIESSQGQEDHVSMGANAATKCYKIIENLEKILAIELLNAAQAVEFRRPLKTSPFLEDIILKYRKTVPFVENDVLMHELIAESIKFIQTENLTNYNL